MSKDKSDSQSSKKRHRSDDPSRSKKRPRQTEPSSATTSQHDASASTSHDASTSDSTSLYHLQRLSLYLAIPPIALAYPTEGLCAEFLSPLLLTYYPPLDGIVLSYSNVRLSEHPEPSSIHVTPTATNPAPVLAKAVDSFTVSFVWLSAEFLVIRPRKDAMVKAWVSYQAPSQLSLVFVNLISVTIRAAHLPRAWKFVQDFGDDDGDAAQSQSPLQSQSKRKKQQKGDGGQGYFVDGDGVKVEGFIVARIVDFEMVTTKAERRNGLLKIEASLVSEEEGREAEGKGAEVGRRVGKTPKGILRHSQES